MGKRTKLIAQAALPCVGLITSFTHATSAFDFKAETKINYRSSELNRFTIGFPILEGAPPQTRWVETVDDGEHFEVSNVALFFHWQLHEDWLVKAKVDAFDLYEKNPTSGDHDVSIDRFFIRYGTRHTQGLLPEQTDFYFQLGKFHKFEQQIDRHLESYGLMSTAFNRVEDSGLETGIDLSSGLYAKLSWTTGNPVFFRDTNALAGDNGVSGSTDLTNGIPILYDAEVEGIDLSENPELGVGIGYRWLSEEGDNRINFLLFSYSRDLAETVELNGTRYGGDIDLLDLSEVKEGVVMPITHREKEESGANIWWYNGNFALFAQTVKQDIAGLERDGWELELSYAFKNLGFANEGLKLKSIIPAVRYSKIDNDFGGHPEFPAPSIWWDWEKTDVGINFDFQGQVRLTLEYAQNEFIRGGKTENNNEYLVTLRWRYD